MSSRVSSIVAFASVAIVGNLGCAQKLNLQNFQSLKPGATTAAEVVELIGKPDAKQSTTVDGKVFELYEFTHYDNYLVKAGQVELLNDRVNSYQFVQAANTGQRITAAEASARIVDRKSTRADVAAILASPSTLARRPTLIKELRDLMPTNAAEMWGYYWFRQGFTKAKVSTLYVFFDASGVVVGKLTREAQ